MSKTNYRFKNLKWKGAKLFLGKRKMMEIYPHPAYSGMFYVKDFNEHIYDFYNISWAKNNAKVFALNLLDLEVAPIAL